MVAGPRALPGAAGSVGDLKKRFDPFEDVLIVEVVFADGPRSFANIDDLTAALGG